MVMTMPLPFFAFFSRTLIALRNVRDPGSEASNDTEPRLALPMPEMLMEDEKFAPSTPRRCEESASTKRSHKPHDAVSEMTSQPRSSATLRNYANMTVFP